MILRFFQIENISKINNKEVKKNNFLFIFRFRSFRRRHVVLILVATILLIFVTSNTHAVHQLRRLDIESIDWTNYEDDIISHVKEELNSIVEDPESFLKSKDNLENSIGK